MKAILLFLIALPAICLGAASPSQIKTLYNSLDPLSVSQHLAFYQLHPQTNEGQKALFEAWKLMGGQPEDLSEINLPALSDAIHALIALVNKQPSEDFHPLGDRELAIIERLASKLPNRQLKGHHAKTESAVLQLQPEEIDLARGLFLSQLGSDEQAMRKLRTYEAMLDLMALQIKARLQPKTTPVAKIRAINDFVFHEMGYRFPPHSLYAKEIDLYTFLPSVLDSRKGVCLGVSILYICLAQRLDLPLEMVTPPGHIYVRYRAGNKVINIETTARGIHIDSEEYLGIDTLALQQRNIKEVIGMAHFNQASVYIKQEDFSKALECYEKALEYQPEDLLVMELMGYCHLILGNRDEGRTLMERIAGQPSEFTVGRDQTPEDLLNGHADPESLKAVFMYVDENRKSILEKQKALKDVVDRCPNFKSGLFSYATTWIQLHRMGEALEVLQKYHELDPGDPKVEYYLAVLYAERYNHAKAWEHLRNAEKITQARNYQPKVLKEFRKELSKQCPE